MRLILRTMLTVTAGLFALSACGGGSSSSSHADGSSLNVRALWQQPAQIAGFGIAALSPNGGFGPTLPRAVKVVTITVDVAGTARCVAVDPHNVPIDPASGQRLLVLHGLPGGPATVTLAGFPSDPSRVGPACEGLRFETPSFRSDPKPVDIIPGTRTDAGDILVFAVPFLLHIDPQPADAPPDLVDPATVRFVVADAVTGVARPVNVIVRQNGTDAAFTGPTVFTACDDAGATPCSDGGDLAVTGFRVAFGPEILPLVNGPAEIDIQATNLDQPPRTLDFSYAVVVVTGPVTPTVPPTPTTSAVPIDTPTATATTTTTPEITITPGPVGSVSGTVINCLTGIPRPATVELLEPINLQTTAGADGLFHFSNVPFGAFRVHAVAQGAITSELSGTLDAANPDATVTLALCPTQSAGLRIVLTWGSAPPAPADLDAHFRGPAPLTSVAGAPVEFHLYFANDSITFANQSVATLDIDNQRFVGPETQTLSALTAGTYRYCVHDFSDRNDPGTMGIANSGAQVQLFLDNEQVGTFSAPSGRGSTWEVFRIDTTQTPPVITAVGTLSDEVDPNRVCRSVDDADGDGLTAAQESALGTDPNNFDTNGNGNSDGQDVIDGHSPL